MRLHSPHHPNLYIPKHEVQFEDGHAEVPDTTARKILTESPHIREIPPEPEPEPPRRKR